jgi:hypothetical protein
MKWFCLALALAALGLPLRGEVGSAAEPLFQVDYSNPGLIPASWTLTLHPDGSGHFRSERGDGAGAGSRRIETPDVDREIQVSAEFAARVFQTAQRKKLSRSQCESRLKVAFQGWKKLRLTGPGGEWSCEFNYSQDKEIQALGESLMAVAETIVEGARLELLLRHDRLGLDSEMEYLVEAEAAGRVQQMEAIREILERLADDPGVMERVRKRARVLLAKAGVREQGVGSREWGVGNRSLASEILARLLGCEGVL